MPGGVRHDPREGVLWIRSVAGGLPVDRSLHTGGHHEEDRRVHGAPQRQLPGAGSPRPTGLRLRGSRGRSPGQSALGQCHQHRERLRVARRTM
eukprot:3559574-Heterocapsa_arctica.AAC.1